MYLHYGCCIWSCGLHIFSYMYYKIIIELNIVSVPFTKPKADVCFKKYIFFWIIISLLSRIIRIPGFSSHLYLILDFWWQSTCWSVHIVYTFYVFYNLFECYIIVSFCLTIKYHLLIYVLTKYMLQRLYTRPLIILRCPIDRLQFNVYTYAMDLITSNQF